MGEDYGKEFQDVFGLLMAPFDPNTEVKQRKAGEGRMVDYITARSVMNRLDDVVGAANWWDEYTPLEHSVICRLSVRLPNGNVLTKSDAGGYAGMADPGDDDKSGYADAFKRAAVKFGIGRHLYKDGVPVFARGAFRDGGGDPKQRGVSSQSPQPTQFRISQPSSQAPSNGNGRSYDDTQMPRDGRGLFAWAMKKDEEMGRKKYAMVNDIEALVEQHGLGYDTKSMTKWSSEQVAEVWPMLVGYANHKPEPTAPRQPATRDSAYGQQPRQTAPSMVGAPRPGDVPSNVDPDVDIPF